MVKSVSVGVLIVMLAAGQALAAPPSNSDTTNVVVSVNNPDFIWVRVKSSLNLGNVSPESAESNGDITLTEAGTVTSSVPSEWGIDDPPDLGKIYRANDAIPFMVVSNRPYTTTVSAGANTGSSNLPSSHLMIETSADTLSHLDATRTITGAGTQVNPGQSGVTRMVLDIGLEVPAFIDTNVDHVISLDTENTLLTTGTVSVVLTFSVTQSE